MDSRTRKLQHGTTWEQVVKTLGGEFPVVGAKQNPDETSVDVLRFGEEKDSGPFVYSQGGKLVQWGDHQLLQNMPGAR